MKITVKGHKLLVKPEEIKAEETTKGDIVIAKTSETVKMERKGVERGTVLQVGPTCFKGTLFNSSEPSWEPWCKEGDLIAFARYSGKFFHDEDSKEDYVNINDEDVQAVLEKEI